jgi:hypothetical protein
MIAYLLNDICLLGIVPIVFLGNQLHIICIYIFIYIVFSKLAGVKNKKVDIIELTGIMYAYLCQYLGIGYKVSSIYPCQFSGWGSE